MASQIGVEPTADRLGGDSSILLRYWDILAISEFSNCKNCYDFKDNFSPKKEQKISVRVYEGCMKRLFIRFEHNMWC